MRHVAAYLLAVLGGNDKPDAAALKNIIEAGGGTVDEEALKKVLSEMDGKDLEVVISEGMEKLASVPSGGGGGGGGGGAPAAAAGGDAAGGDAPAKAEAKKEESEEEEDMDFGLFD